jgi:YVTN family beta-propeller protein
VAAAVALLAAGVEAACSSHGNNAAKAPVPSHYTVGPDINIGNRDMNGMALDSAHHTLYLTNGGDNSISVVDTNTRSLTGTIPVDHPFGISLDQPGHTLWVILNAGNAQQGSVAMIDTNSRRVIATIPVGQDPEGIEVDPGSHTAYVANAGANSDGTVSHPGSVSVIDPERHSVTATIPVGWSPQGMTVDPADHSLYVYSGLKPAPGSTDRPDIWVVDTASMKTTVIPSDQVQGGGVLDAPAHTIYIVLGDLGVESKLVGLIDTTSNRLGTTFPVSGIESGMDLDTDARRLIVTGLQTGVVVIDLNTRSIMTKIPTAEKVGGVAVDRTTHTIYAATAHDVIHTITGAS